MLFARSIDIRKGKGVLAETAFTNFMKIYELCDLHAARETTTMPLLSMMLSERMGGKRKSV